MFNIRNLQAMLAFHDPPGRPQPPPEQEIDRLRDRVAELEEENINLRRLEDIIQKNARMFNAILRKSREGVGLLTPDLIVLRALHSALGYQEVELLGQSVLSMIHPDDSSGFQESFSHLLSAQAKCTSCEVRVKKEDGSWAWVSFEMTDMLDDPDVQAILVNTRTINRT